MSQHYLQTRLPSGDPVTIMMGWDRPLAMFFLVVEGDPTSDSYLYSNLDDEHAKGQPLSYFIDKLHEMGINVPYGMVNDILVDERLNAGNRRVFWDPHGNNRHPF